MVIQGRVVLYFVDLLPQLLEHVRLTVRDCKQRSLFYVGGFVPAPAYLNNLPRVGQLALIFCMLSLGLKIEVSGAEFNFGYSHTDCIIDRTQADVYSRANLGMFQQHAARPACCCDLIAFFARQQVQQNCTIILIIIMYTNIFRAATLTS